MPGRPLVISEEVPFEKEHGNAELDLMRPLGGPMWWNSLYWTNFPPLSCFDDKHWSENRSSEFHSAMALLNEDNKLSDQYVSFAAAREDLCHSRAMPDRTFQLTAECMQYEGVRDCTWNFPLQGYIPKRDNHQPYDIQARRFYDNGVLHMGINAEEFSQKLMPVGELDACITVADYVNNPTWGYYHLLLRIGGWPYRIKKIGTFEGYGEGGHHEVTIGLHYFDESIVWDMLEGSATMAPTGPNGEMEVQGNTKVGHKMWVQLLDLDWLGPKIDEKQHYDPTVAQEKGYVWLRIVDTITVPSTGHKGVKVEILDEGIVPAWLDLNFLQAFVGDFPLGFLREAESEETNGGSVKVCRTFDARKVVCQNNYSKLVFDEPISAQVNDFCDMGWGMFEALFKGASVQFGPSAKFDLDHGQDEGLVDYKASGPAPLCHIAWGKDEICYTQVPKSSYPCERRLVT